MIDIMFHDETGAVSRFPGETDGFEYAVGSGEIQHYRLFGGVGILLLRLEMDAYTEIRTRVNMLEINFCIDGRLIEPTTAGNWIQQNAPAFRVDFPAIRKTCFTANGIWQAHQAPL